MRGTEKQIKWAEEIQIAVLEAVDQLIEEGKTYVGNPKAEAAVAKLIGQREAIANCDYAGDMIECFRLVLTEETAVGRCRSFFAACRVTGPNSPTQHKMLGK